MSPAFEWDAAKAAENVQKHGVAFEEALTVFADPVLRTGMTEFGASARET